MKVMNLFALILSLSLMTSSVYAVENLSMEPAAISSSSSASGETFRAVVTGDGKLLLNPGAVFTDGGHYEGVKMPYLLTHSKSIDYPRWAIRQGWQGELNLAVEVLLNGTVGRYKVMKSTGHKALDEAAVKAVRTWRFHPAVKNGEMIVTCIEIPVRFQIDGQV